MPRRAEKTNGPKLRGAPDACRDKGHRRPAAVKAVGIVMKEYWAPFRDYPNIVVESPFRGLRDEAYDGKGLPHKHGLEIERDTGFIRIAEAEPIIAVSVLGSGCALPAYVTCEYPQPDETMKETDRSGPWKGFNLQNLRRQRVDGMMSIHPSIFMRPYPQDIISYEMDFEPRCFECSARFEIEPTTTVTIRGGSGTSAHFSFRMIRVYQERETDRR